VPQAEILVEPIDYQPELRPLERRFEGDINLAFFDLQPD
jgi:hypothetical protein